MPPSSQRTAWLPALESTIFLGALCVLGGVSVEDVSQETIWFMTRRRWLRVWRRRPARQLPVVSRPWRPRRPGRPGAPVSATAISRQALHQRRRLAGLLQVGQQLVDDPRGRQGRRHDAAAGHLLHLAGVDPQLRGAVDGGTGCSVCTAMLVAISLVPSETTRAGIRTRSSSARAIPCKSKGIRKFLGARGWELAKMRNAKGSVINAGASHFALIVHQCSRSAARTCHVRSRRAALGWKRI